MTAMMKMATSTIGPTMLDFFSVASVLCAEADVSWLALCQVVMEEVIVEIWDSHIVVATVYSVVHSVV
jgi:hypothetical protein